MSLLEDVEKETAQVGKVARLVVAKRVAIVAVITVVLQLLIAYHIITPDLSSQVESYIKDGLDVLGTLVAILYAQKGVTPLNDPRNSAGTPLIPATRAQAAIENVESELPAAAAAVEQAAHVSV